MKVRLVARKRGESFMLPAQERYNDFHCLSMRMKTGENELRINWWSKAFCTTGKDNHENTSTVNGIIDKRNEFKMNHLALTENHIFIKLSYFRTVKVGTNCFLITR